MQKQQSNTRLQQSLKQHGSLTGISSAPTPNLTVHAQLFTTILQNSSGWLPTLHLSRLMGNSILINKAGGVDDPIEGLEMAFWLYLFKGKKDNYSALIGLKRLLPPKKPTALIKSEMPQSYLKIHVTKTLCLWGGWCCYSYRSSRGGGFRCSDGLNHETIVVLCVECLQQQSAVLWNFGSTSFKPCSVPEPSQACTSTQIGVEECPQ